MSKGFIIFLIVLGAVIVIALALIITLTVINNKYKNFVLENSGSIKKLKELNNRMLFKIYTSSFTLRHRYDNKSNWKKTEPGAYFSMKIRNDLEYWSKLLSAVKFNIDLLKDYEKEIATIETEDISENCCLNANMNYKKCLKTEVKLFNSLIKKPSITLNVDVVLRYVSPKGKVDLSKKQTFNYVDTVRIFDSVSSYRVDRSTYEKLVKAERGILSDSMRYDVMKRDGFRCVICGMSARDGAILHVDHIIPIAKGGKTEMSNLQTLCEKCNLGKSDKI